MRRNIEKVFLDRKQKVYKVTYKSGNARMFNANEILPESVREFLSVANEEKLNSDDVLYLFVQTGK